MKIDGSFVHASHIAWKDVRHRRALRCLAKLYVVTNANIWGLQRFEGVVVERFDGGVFNGAVHPLGLAVGPGVVWLGKAMLDLVCEADAIEDVGTKITSCWALAVFG